MLQLLQNNHVIVNGVELYHFDDYNHNCESMTINMPMIITRGNYDYKYNYMTNVTILK
jgi:hypothetical protein